MDRCDTAMGAPRSRGETEYLELQEGTSYPDDMDGRNVVTGNVKRLLGF